MTLTNLEGKGGGRGGRGGTHLRAIYKCYIPPINCKWGGGGGERMGAMEMYLVRVESSELWQLGGNEKIPPARNLCKFLRYMNERGSEGGEGEEGGEGKTTKR